jgi:hypothetical protein
MDQISFASLDNTLDGPERADRYGWELSPEFFETDPQAPRRWRSTEASIVRATQPRRVETLSRGRDPNREEKRCLQLLKRSLPFLSRRAC